MKRAHLPRVVRGIHGSFQTESNRTGPRRARRLPTAAGLPGRFGALLAAALVTLVAGCLPALAVISTKPLVSGHAPAAVAVAPEPVPLSMEAGFERPPADARPETWFHLIGGNVSKAGLTRDLEAVKGAGLRGIQLFHGQFGGPWPGVDPQIACLSPSWDGMIRHVADECRRLGLRFTMQNCPGWAMSGGPWITPDKAMRHLVWNRRDVAGGQKVGIVLPRPEPSGEPWRDYRDVAVLAFPTPEGDDGTPLVPMDVAAGGGDAAAWKQVLAGAKGAKVRLEPGAGERAPWVEVRFATPVFLRSLELPPVERFSLRRNFDPGVTLRVQAVTGTGLVDVARRVVPRSSWQDDRPLTLALPDFKAAAFRLTFELQYPLEIASLSLSGAARSNDWQGRGAHVLRSLERLDGADAPRQDPGAWVAEDRIVDLSDRLDAATGRLDWVAPAGRTWTVVRFGHVNTGARNAPAPKEATGFECDKLAAAGAEQHFAGYIGRLSASGGPAGDGRLQGMLIDSWECRTQTWTPAMEREFGSRRGYALRPWLPAIAGWVVGGPERSGRFLRDWRATISDLLVDNYFGRMAALGRERGLTLSFETAIGDVSPGDMLRYFGQADIPMCEFWQPNDPHWGGLETKPILPCASAAHIYGKPLVAAEAFTCTALRWNEHPFMLKHLADRHFTYGVNHLVFHTYTHNPRADLVPGTSFGAGIGTPFIRGQTWWRHMPAFTDYLARCQWLLTRGRPVADVLWYIGDEVDHKPRQDAYFPDGYKFDYVNADVLLHRLRVAGGSLTTPEGLSWRVLWLRDCPRLTVATLGRLRELVAAGATVIGAAPEYGPAGLEGGAADERRFGALVRELWGEVRGASGDRRIGAGRLLWGGTLEEALRRCGIEPDVAGTSSATWCHRSVDGRQVYFVAAGRETPLRANLRFRATGRVEFWDPLRAARTAAPVWHASGGFTTVPVDLPAAGSVFVMFGEEGRRDVSQVVRLECDGAVLADARDAHGDDRGAPARVQGLGKEEKVQPWVAQEPPQAELELEDGRLVAWRPGNYRVVRADGRVHIAEVTGPGEQRLEGPWVLNFPEGWDTPRRIELPALLPWSSLEPAPVRHFSGSATYACSFELPHVAWAGDRRVVLDLGRVEVIAEVSVNGGPAATLWAAPYTVDVTPCLRAGANRIEVTVTNPWFNRLAYDAGLPAAQRRTWTIAAPKAGTPPEPAGLIGPVRLRIGRVAPLQ